MKTIFKTGLSHIASWSGGKDSSFACYKALKSGMDISYLVHFQREFNLHGVDPEIIRLQAELAGINILQRKIVTEDFEKEFKETVSGLLGNGIKGMVFGDIYLNEHKEWVDRVCGEMGIEAVEPLWGMNTEVIMKEFLDHGFETVIVSGQEKFIDKEWIGKKINNDFIGYLKARDLDVCGENGEYHTLVTAGPLFNGRIEISSNGVSLRNEHWFLDVNNFKAVR